MFKSIRLSAAILGAFLCIALAFTPGARAQQTLGGLTGAVTDDTGAVVPNATVTIVNDQTKLTRTQMSNEEGTYLFVGLPIGTYTITFTREGFQSQSVPSVQIQANRTATVSAALKLGEVATTVTVEETPLINAVDTTNGYVLDKAQLESIPLPTGSFTGIAILSPGVNAELSSGTGANAGLGNQPIWANGQRDTSNTFLLNGVDASNLFNGKSTSSVASARIVNNTGIGGAASISSTTAEPLQATASPYLAIGQALPTPPPETISEFRANTSMYDAQQGSTSGAHIDLSTASGTNNIHGQAYLHHGYDGLDAAPFFNKQNGNIPQADKVPGLSRYVTGGTVGAPIIKDKLFIFASYQYVHTDDQEIGSSRVSVPALLTNNRSAAALAAVNNAGNFENSVLPVVGVAPGDISPIAYGILNYKLPNGQFLIPSAGTYTPTVNFPENTFTLGDAYFIANQANGNLDWNASSKDTLSLKYYYQHDPSIAPYAYSGSPGFTQNLDAGSQVASITNTQTLTPNLSITEVFGFIREKVYSTIQQPFSPQQLATYIMSLNLPGVTLPQATINTFGSTRFPGMSIVDDFGNEAGYNSNFVFNAATNIGSGANSQGAFTGVFQNRFMPSVDLVWTKGKHTFNFGGSYSYTQLNPRDRRTNNGTLGFTDFSTFLTGEPITYTADGFITTNFLQGNANRYYRSNETGEYIQDKFQFRSNLTFSLGLRFDYHGGLTEKNGKLYNFDPARYSYNANTGTINGSQNGFIIAGNNPLFPTTGVSSSTLTGRQWGFAPRIGIAWSPKKFNSKVVVRAGWGMYYDRGELFTYLSPGFASGVIAGGPFGVSQSPPYVNEQQCTIFAYSTCSFQNPFGPTLGPPPSGNPATLVLPTASEIEDGQPLFSFAVYNRANKLPYTMNQTLNVQWQPRNDLAIEIGYVGNLGRHQVIPLPFNQPGIATATNVIHPGTFGQKFTYGYSILSDPATFTPALLPDGSPYLLTFEGGNTDLRVPYVGYSAESESYTAAGISAYNALQVHVDKRLSHGLQVSFSYTYSHATDEQSAMGLFYNGNNPLDLRSGYGLSDFDRTHVINFTYLYQLPKFASESSFKGKLIDGWAVQGLTILQSGQPYSVIDYSGAVGSIYFGVNDGITNPIVPLNGCSPKQAMTGYTGATPGLLALNPDCFTVQTLTPGVNGVPSNDPYETSFIDKGQRNIFRQPWQRRADISIVKNTKLTERVSLRSSLDVFNLTNTASFDVPINNVSQNINFNGFPAQGTPAKLSPCNEGFTGSLYVCPNLSGLGVTNKTISSPRQIQMSFSVLF